MRTEKGLSQSLALRKLILRKRMGKNIFQTLHPGCLANPRSGRVPGGSHPSTENSALQLGQNRERTVGKMGRVVRRGVRKGVLAGSGTEAKDGDEVVCGYMKHSSIQKWLAFQCLVPW